MEEKNDQKKEFILEQAEKLHEKRMEERYRVHKYEDPETIELIEDYIEEA